MFVRFAPGKLDVARKRLFAAGVDIAGNDFEVCESGLEMVHLEPTEDDDREVYTETTVMVRKNCLAVSVNPDLIYTLGYMPACPPYLYPGDAGVFLKTKTAADAKKLLHAASELSWVVRLHLILVNAPA